MAMKAKKKGNKIMTVRHIAEYLQMDEHTIYKLYNLTEEEIKIVENN